MNILVITTKPNFYTLYNVCGALYNSKRAFTSTEPISFTFAGTVVEIEALEIEKFQHFCLCSSSGNNKQMNAVDFNLLGALNRKVVEKNITTSVDII